MANFSKYMLNEMETSNFYKGSNSLCENLRILETNLNTYLDPTRSLEIF